MRRLLVLLALLAGACGQADDAHDHSHGEDESWAVTSWGERYEIFAECEPLIAGHAATSHTHVTVLSDFSPLRTGKVSAVLRSSDGTESVFTQGTALRDGIFNVVIEPATAGDYDLFFRVDAAAGSEEVPAGRVRVGPHDAPGGIVESPAPGGDANASPVGFLKEQQWKTAFRTAWTGEGAVPASVRGPAKVRAAAGAEVLLTAPLDGVVGTSTRVYIGREAKKGDVLVSLAPRAPSNLTLPELEAETGVARSRVSRLDELLKIGAVSPAEAEAARATLAGLESRLDAAKGSTDGTLAIRAPFDGRVAESSVTPGGAVNAGDPLVRLVRTPPVWIEASLAPADAARVHGAPVGVTLESPGVEPVVIDAADLRLISISPEIDRATGAVTVIIESARAVPFPLGSFVSSVLLMQETSSGIVLPAEAIVDDNGTPVVYLQVDGESFERREITVAARHGNQVVVGGLRANERVVVVGGNAIRRASLLSSGEVEGHVH